MTSQHPRRLDFLLSQTLSAWDGLWLLILAGYVMAGVALVPFHGDEAMQVTMSRDYFTAFVNGQAQTLPVSPPYTIDSPAWLRLINGSVNVYTVGLSLHLNGYGEHDLPTLWEWPLGYDENVIRGHRPDANLLTISRIPSAFFLASSAVMLFAIGWQFRGRFTAYAASGLYVLSPVVLLNGRRAMMEGSVLCFGLLAILLAILICKGRTSWRWWLLLGVASGLTLVSKHSGVVFVASAFGWMFIHTIKPPSRQEFLNTETPTRKRGLASLVMSGLLAVVVVVAASPALWGDPAERLGDLLSERAQLLESQVKAEPSAPTPLSERVSGILTQPYMQPPIYFEAAFWANAAPIQTEIAAYDGSILSGLHAGTLLGGMLTLLAVVGTMAIAREWRTWQIGLLLWIAITAASLLVNPLPWQRYYLSLYPLVTLLTSIGISSMVTWFAQRRSTI